MNNTFLIIAAILMMTFLLVAMVYVCTTSGKGPLSTKALLHRLRLLQAKFLGGEMINPEQERDAMEKLHNDIKTRSEPAMISANADLQQLSISNCQSIEAVLEQPALENRTSWIQLKNAMFDFNAQYFGK